MDLTRHIVELASFKVPPVVAGGLLPTTSVGMEFRGIVPHASCAPSPALEGPWIHMPAGRRAPPSAGFIEQA